MSAPSVLQRHLRFSALLVLLASVTTCGIPRPMENGQPPPTTTPFTIENSRPSPTATPSTVSTPLAQLAMLGEGTVNALAWSPDGKRMAVGGSLGIHLYDAETLRETKHIDTQSWVRSLAFSPDGRTLAAGPRDNVYDSGAKDEITLWDVDTGRLLRTIDAKDTGLVVAFGPDGHTLATQGNEAAQLWDVTTGERPHRLEGREIVVSPNLHIAIFEELHGPLTLWDLNSGKHLYTLEETEIDTHRVTFSPDGHTLALSTNHQVGEPDVIKVFDVESGQLLHTLEGPWYSYFLALSPDGRRLAAGGSDDVVQVWDMTTGQSLCTLTEQEYSYSLAFSPDGHTLAVGSNNHTLYLWDTTTCQPANTFEGLGRIHSIAFSPDGRILAVSTDVGCGKIDVHLFDAYTGQIPRTFESQLLNSIALTSDGRLFVSRSDETTSWRWHTATRQLTLLNTFPGSRLMALSPDGRRLALVDGHKPAQGTLDTPLTGQSGWGADESVQVWDTGTGRLTYTLAEGPRARVSGMAFSPDGKLLASTTVTSSWALSPPIYGTGTYSPIQLWDVETGALLAIRRGYPAAISLEAFATGERLFTTRCTGDSCSRRSCDLAMWDVGDLVSRGDDATSLWSDHDLGLPAQNVLLNADRTMAITRLQDTLCINDTAVVAWDVETGQKILTLSFDFEHSACSVTLSPVGTVIAVGTLGESLGLWDLQTGQRLRTLEGLTTNAAHLAYSPDGRWLVSGNCDGKIQLWSAETGQLLYTQAGHTLAVTSLLFSPDGRTLYSAGADGTVRVWGIAPENLATIQEALPIIPGIGCVTLPITASANTDLNWRSTGYVTPEGIPFYLSSHIFKSQASTPPHDLYPTSILLEKDVPHAQRVHLLLNTGNGFTEFEGQAIGQVVAHCNDVPKVVADLRLGQEVREWHAAANVVSTAAHTHQVWSGYIFLSTPAERGHIDMLSLDLPAACQEGRLTAIEVIDTSSDTISSLDPGLNLFGVTVEHRQ
jgi:WD40 repeat protein